METKKTRGPGARKDRPNAPTNNNLDAIGVGIRLTEYLDASGLKQADIVHYSGVGKDTISRLFNPQRKQSVIPHTNNIYKVCEVFKMHGIDVDYNYIFTGEKHEIKMVIASINNKLQTSNEMNQKSNEMNQKSMEMLQRCIEMLSSIASYRDCKITPSNVTDTTNDRVISAMSKFHTDIKFTNNSKFSFSVRSLSYESGEDEYVVSRGNIYRIANDKIYQIVSIDDARLMSLDSVETLKRQYRKRRPFMGGLSILSTNEFIWLTTMIALAENTNTTQN